MKSCRGGYEWGHNTLSPCEQLSNSRVHADKFMRSRIGSQVRRRQPVSKPYTPNGVTTHAVESWATESILHGYTRASPPTGIRTIGR